MALTNKKSNFKNQPRLVDVSSLVHGKIPPQSIELEEAVLGALLLEKEKLEEVFMILPSPDYFYVDAHRKIYSTMQLMYQDGKSVDMITVTQELSKTGELETIGGPYFISRLVDQVVSSAHVERHAMIVVEKHIQRQLIRISGESIADAYEDTTDVFEMVNSATDQLMGLVSNLTGSEIKHSAVVLRATLLKMEEQRKHNLEFTGVDTGLTGLSKVTGGWQNTDLIILAARPAVGKTAFAINLAYAAAASGVPTAFFSLEMGAEQLVKRRQANVSGVEMELFKNPSRMTESEFQRVIDATNSTANLPVYIDDTAGLSIVQFRAKAKKLKKKRGIGLIIIDYLQLMQCSSEKGGNREQEISKITRDLKLTAKELDIPIIALSQLNRGLETRSANNKVPLLSDLRESGAIEQDADMVMFLYKPEADPMGGAIEDGETHIYIAKHRNGDTCVLKVIFEKAYQRFRSFDASPFSSEKKPDNPRAGIGRQFTDFTESKKPEEDQPF